MIAIQIGAGTGNDSFYEWLKEQEDCEAFLYEPHPQSYEKLVEFYADKNLNVHLFNKAVVDKNQKFIEFYLSENSDLSSVIKKSFANKPHRVEAENLNSLLSNFEEVEMLWIDAEGYDYQLIDSLNLASNNIKNIVFEKLQSSWGGGYFLDNQYNYIAEENFENQIMDKLLSFKYTIYNSKHKDMMDNYWCEK
jgi:FkbM family methyltransferase